MTEAIDQIQKLFESQQGVYIDIEVSCQKCDEVTSPDMGGEISIFPLTTHLDWKTHTSWYIDTDAGKSGVARVFNLDDITGILQALAVSFGLALQNITY